MRRGLGLGLNRYRRAGVSDPSRIDLLIDAAGASLYQLNDALEVEDLGGGLIRLPDLSGNGRTFSSTTSAGTPTSSVDPTLGAVLEFDGVNNGLESDAPDSDYTILHSAVEDLHCFWIGRIDGVGVNQTLYANSNGSTRQGVRAYVDTSGNDRQIIYNGQSGQVVSSLVVAAGVGASLFEGSLAPAGAEIRNTDTDGVTSDSNGTVANTPSTDAPTFSLFLGVNRNGFQPLEGAVAGFLILRNPTAQQLTDVREVIRVEYLGLAPRPRINAVIQAAGASLYQLNDALEVEDLGGGLIRLPDLSGNGRHLDSLSAGTTPTVADNPALSGAVIRFTGSEYLQSVAPASDYNLLHDPTDAGHLLTVSGGAGTIASNVRANGQNGIRVRTQAGGTTARTVIYSDQIVTNSAATSGTQSLDSTTGAFLSARVSANAANGVEFTGVNVANDDFSVTRSPTLLSNGNPTYSFQVGRLANGGDGFVGDVPCIIILKNPTPQQLADVNEEIRVEYLGLGSSWNDSGSWDDSGTWGG